MCLFYIFIIYLFIEVPENMLYCDVYRYQDMTYIGMEDLGHIARSLLGTLHV